MRPVSHTSNPFLSISAPWEIVRMQLPLSSSTNNSRTIDLYTKSGDIGSYSSMLSLDVDHAFGFSILTASESASAQRTQLASIVAASWVTAFEDAAREEANAKLTGTFANMEQNSTLTLEVNSDRPGLGVRTFISRGVDTKMSLRRIMNIEDSKAKISIRLYPNGLSNDNIHGFRAVFEALPYPADTSIFNDNCHTWLTADSLIYGSIGLGNFEIVVNGTGEAVEVRARGFRETLTRIA
jgi:hypothetical protein